MKKAIKQIVSLWVALAIFATTLPVSAFGLDDGADSVSGQSSTQTVAPLTEAELEAIAEQTAEEEAFVLSEIESKREPNAKYYRMSNGSITAAIYPYDVHYTEEDGSLQDIDNTLTDGTDEGDSVYTNKKNSTFVKFMKKSNKNKLYTINQNGYKIKAAIEGAEKVNATVTEYESESADSPYKLDSLTGQVTYYGILPNTDIQYTYTSTTLKENIIINEKTDFDSLVYNYHVTGSIDVVQNNAQSISVYEKGTQELIMEITAPTLWDSAGNYYDGLTVTLTESKNSKFTVKLDWTVPEGSVYPVTVDPIMNFTASGDDIQDTHITTYGPNLNYDNNNHIRISNNAYALVQYPLPTLQSGDRIINARLVLTPYCMHPNAESAYSMANSYDPPVNIAAHAINSPWLEETATYNNVNPENGFYDPEVIDYRKVDGDGTLYTWDVTRLANEWADGYSVNNGILLKYESPAPIDSFDAFFLATNGTYVSPSMYPAIIYQYINTTGIESYLSYHTYSAGYAGTVYTNDLTGNVTLVNPIVQTGGNLMPITVSMVYNLDNEDTNDPYGRCWWMNWSQRLDKSSEYNFADIEHVRYRDGDGTEHYFKYDTTENGNKIYKDEINPDRTLELNTTDYSFKMTDSSGTSMYFAGSSTSTEWFLTKVEDAYGNNIIITLEPTNNNRVNKVQSFTVGNTTANNTVDFVYSEYGFLTQVKYYDEGNTARTVYIEYNNHSNPANNCIGKITYADNTSVEYYYADGTNCLSRVDDIDDYHIEFGYTNGTPKRVNHVKEYASDNTAGIEIDIEYASTATYITDKTESDNVRKYLYSFAKNGTPKSVVDVTENDGNGYGQYYEYNNGNTAVIEGTDRLTFESKTQKSTVNMLNNHSFETTGSYTFTAWEETTGTSSGVYDTSKSYMGARSYKLTRPSGSNSTRTLGYYSVTLEGGKEYTLSAYVNTDGMVSNGGGASLFIHGLSEEYESEIIKTASNEWTRLSVTFTVPSSTGISACMSLKGATGSVWFDCIQLEAGGLSDYNILENAGFESGHDSWYVFSDDASISQTYNIGGVKSAALAGGANNVLAQYRQMISVPGGKKDDTYVASAFAKAISPANTEGEFSVFIRFMKADWTEVSTQNIPFNTYTTEWQKVSGVAKATGDYELIQFWLLYTKKGNTVYFDNAQLIKDTFGNTYTYDDEGNLISTIDLQGKEDNTFTYDGSNQLIKQSDVSGGRVFYAYDQVRKQQLNHVTSGGITTSYVYDSKGNATSTQTHANLLESGKYYYIANSKYGEYLDVDNYGNTAGTNVKLEQYSENTAQRWKVTAKGDGTYSISPECSPELLLSVEGNLTGNSNLALYPAGAKTYQSFTLEKVNSNIYVMKPANGYSADVDKENNYNCVINTTDAEDEEQQFAFISADYTASADNPKLTSSATYTNSGEYMSSITDSRGNTTNYSYNEKRGYTTKEVNAKGAITKYYYNGKTDLLSGVDVLEEEDGIEAAWVQYFYDTNKRLSKISTINGTKYSFTYDGFGRTTSVKVGDNVLSTYTYNAKGLPASLEYGNNYLVEWKYDALNRKTEHLIDGELIYQYRYDGMSRLTEIIDHNINDVIRYEYDILGRITAEKVFSGSDLLSKLNIRYDDTKNRIAGYDVLVDNLTQKIDYVYGGNGVAPDVVTGVKLNDSALLTYGYDNLNRLSTRTINKTTTPYVTEYSYLPGVDATSTTTLISSVKNGNDTLTYTYDVLGNITSVSKNGVLIESYTYDILNQLQTVTRGNDTWRYSYGSGGNISSVSKNGTVTDRYTYGNSQWKDQLTAYNGNTITYDEIGNPTEYYNGASLGWTDGRRLVSYEDSESEYWYEYDVDGNRQVKFNFTSFDLVNYRWLDGRLYSEVHTDYTLMFVYDENGSCVGFDYVTDSGTTSYYYVFNLQGDVIGILDSTGTVVVEYTYDEWGKPLTVTGTLATTIGVYNPIRYRGYYYDTETGLYYVSSRYYDPEIGRFINADGFVSTGQDITGYNMFAYCGNNPVNRVDPTGQFWITALIVTAVAVFCTVTLSGCSAQPTSDVGAAKPYIYMPKSDDKTSPNCYAYAIGSPVNEQPGETSGRIPTKWNDVNDVGKSVEADLKAKGYTVRKISGPDAKVYDNEFKIALRVGTQPYAYDPYTGQLYYDYHFMRQTNTGRWAEKHGYGGESILWDPGMTPDTIPWTLGGVPYYDSAIIYYAVGN